VGPGGISSSGFEAPWAHDAAGRDLATEYALDGNRIVRRVDLDEDTAYPVTADPKLTTGWVTGTVYFNIPETIEIGDTSWFSSACAALTRFGPVGAPSPSPARWRGTRWPTPPARPGARASASS